MEPFESFDTKLINFNIIVLIWWKGSFLVKEVAVMNNKRPEALASKKFNVKWPSFSDLYQTSDADSYMAWMLTHNPHLTEQDVLDLDDIRIEQMYKKRRQ